MDMGIQLNLFIHLLCEKIQPTVIAVVSAITAGLLIGKIKQSTVNTKVS